MLDFYFASVCGRRRLWTGTSIGANTYNVYGTRGRCILTLVSRTNIDIDETLIEIAMRKYGVHTKTEAVDRALREVAFQPMSTAEILACGELDFWMLQRIRARADDPGRHVGLGGVLARDRIRGR